LHSTHAQAFWKPRRYAAPLARSIRRKDAVLHAYTVSVIVTVDVGLFGQSPGHPMLPQPHAVPVLQLIPGRPQYESHAIGAPRGCPNSPLNDPAWQGNVMVKLGNATEPANDDPLAPAVYP
jgi:hypothetical protein